MEGIILLKQGIAFGDHIKLEKIQRYHYPSEHRYSFRGYVFVVTIVLSSLLLFVKLFSLQIMNGSYYRGLSDSNRIRTHIVHAPRGVIFDRNNVPLVLNIPGFRETKGDKTRIIPHEEALSRMAKGEISIEVDSLRQYPLAEATGHVLGYIGQVTKEQLRVPEFAKYHLNDFVGKTGIERQYEHTLRGIDGKQLVEIDAMGKAIRTLGQTDPIPGHDITLTLDAKLQKAVYTATTGMVKGAVVVSTPNGEILAMLSRPAFDPNLFTLDSSYHTASDSGYQTISDVLLDGEKQPLLNRTIGGAYPPGSTFKIVTAAAGLENRIIDENYHVEDIGVLTVGAFSFANWYYTEYGRKEVGEVDVVRGLARSNDIFFYKLAEKIGVDTLADMAKKTGVGKQTGIDLGGEVSGTLPTQDWKKEVIKEQWYLGDTYHYGIGQGYLLTTPLQVNSWTEVIANGGSLYVPHLLKNSKSEIRNSKFLSEKTISLIRQGMIDACSPSGVAWPLFEFRIKNQELRIDNKNIFGVDAASGSAEMRRIPIACKTGTAQHGGETTLPHAWITLFAPAYNPEIVVTVLNEASGEGSNEAAPIAKKILEAWFGEKKN